MKDLGVCLLFYCTFLAPRWNLTISRLHPCIFSPTFLNCPSRRSSNDIPCPLMRKRSKITSQATVYKTLWRERILPVSLSNWWFAIFRLNDGWMMRESDIKVRDKSIVFGFNLSNSRIKAIEANSWCWLLVTEMEPFLTRSMLPSSSSVLSWWLREDNVYIINWNTSCFNYWKLWKNYFVPFEPEPHSIE